MSSPESVVRTVTQGVIAMRMSLSLLVVFAALWFSTPVAAHHSFAAEFDGTKPVTLTGAVTKVEWRNPHIWVYLDVRSADGTVTAWQCEGGAPNVLTRQGWGRTHLKLGEDLIVGGYLAKDGTNTCNAQEWKLPDGTTLFEGSAGDRGPEAPSGR